MRFTTLLAIAGVGLISLMGGAQAEAGSCPSEQSVLPYSKNDPPFQCAQSHWSDKKSIAAWDTKSWTKSTAYGYTVKSHCKYKSSSDVSVTEAWNSSSYTATATNFATGTRHFAAGVLFTTGSVDSGGYSNGCESSKGQIKHSIQKVTSSFNLKDGYQNGVVGQPITFSGVMSPVDAPGMVYLQMNDQPVIDMSSGEPVPVGGAIKDGSWKFKWVPTQAGTFKVTLAYGGDTSRCPTLDKSCGFSPKVSGKKTVTVTEPSSQTATSLSAGGPVMAAAGGGIGSAPAASTENGGPAQVSAAADTRATKDTGIVTKTKTAKMPARLSIGCPKGSIPLHAEIFGANTGRSLEYRSDGVSLKKGAVANGRRASIQLTCRGKSEPKAGNGRVAYGTGKADRMRTSAGGGLLLGGPGADRLTVRHGGGVAHGGLGGDSIVIRGGNGVATGGPGTDVIRSKTRGRSLLIGGPGRDLIVTSRGITLVDARDGERDEIRCHGSRSQVRADPVDVMSGNCKTITLR